MWMIRFLLKTIKILNRSESKYEGQAYKIVKNKKIIFRKRLYPN